MPKKKVLAAATLVLGSFALTGCRTAAGTGSILGAGVGTALGSAIGHHNGNQSAGMLIGGAVGALSGYAIGNEVDKQNSGTRWEGDPRYDPRYQQRSEPRYDQRPYDPGTSPRRRTYVRHDDRYDDDEPVYEEPRERIVYRERRVIRSDPRCEPCW